MSDKCKVFCFPFAGGSKYAYSKFLSRSSDIEFIALDIPGRGSLSRKPLLTDINKITDSIFNQLRPSLVGSYSFFGHSMGALLSYLVARKIQLKGLSVPNNLFVSGSGGPSVKNRITNTYTLPKSKFFNEIKKLGGTDSFMFNNEQLTEIYEPILRADFEAVENYKHKNSILLNIPITVIYGDNDYKVNENEARAWQLESMYKIDLITRPGDHFFILGDENFLVETIKAKLNYRTCEVY